MKIFDRIIRDGAGLPEDGDIHLEHDRYLGQMPKSTLFDMSNVAAYLSTLSDTKRGDFRIRSLPCFVPPYPVIFAEAQLPPVTEDRWMGELRQAGLRAYGSLYITSDLFFKDSDSPVQDATKFAQSELDNARVGNANNEPALITSDVRWVIQSYLFMDLGNTKIIGPMTYSVMFLKPDGTIASMNNQDSIACVAYQFFNITGDDSDAAVIARLMNIAPLFGFSLLHCRNVTMTENAPYFESRQSKRLADRRNDPPRSKYYTLEIGQMTSVLNNKGDAEKSGLKKALHICRGHFSHYSEEKPLFGKYSGQFWIPSHVRGSAESGKVVKDYSVKAPKQTAA